MVGEWEYLTKKKVASPSCLFCQEITQPAKRSVDFPIADYFLVGVPFPIAVGVSLQLSLYSEPGLELNGNDGDLIQTVDIWKIRSWYTSFEQISGGEELNNQ